MLVICDGKRSCGETFELEEFITTIENDIEKIYFKCPNCGKEFVSYYTNKYIRKKQELIKGVKSESALKILKEDIAKDMKKLRTKVEY